MGIIAVWGPPHSGKTTLSIDLAYALAFDGQSVCLISTEEYSELGARLNTRIPPEQSLSAIDNNCKGRLKQIVRSVDDLLFILAVPYDYDAFGNTLGETAVKELFMEAGEVFDFVIVDCVSDVHNMLSAWAMQYAQKVLMTTGSNRPVIPWFHAKRRAFQPLADKTDYISVQVSSKCDTQSLFNALGVHPIAWLPYIKDADVIQMQKRTLCRTNGKAGKRYRRALAQLCQILIGQEGDNK